MQKDSVKSKHVCITKDDITNFVTEVCMINQKFENTTLRSYDSKNVETYLNEVAKEYLEQRISVSEDFANKILEDVNSIDDSVNIQSVAKEIAEEIIRLANGSSSANIPFTKRIDKIINEIKTEENANPDESTINHLLQLKFLPNTIINYLEKLFQLAEVCKIPGIDTQKKESPFFAMLHGKATDAIATMVGTKYAEDEVTKDKTFTSNEVQLVVTNSLDNLVGTLGISTHKLLSTAIGIFTANNNTGNKKRDLRALKVTIPFKEYALKRGYNVTEKPKDTPEEQEREKNRAQNALREARKQIKKDLELIYNASISWKEMVKNKEQSFLDVRIISSKGIIKNGLIVIGFTPEIGEYLIQLPLTQYPTALLSLDERAVNAYNMGLKMSEHYNNDNNQIKGTAQVLKVKTLLKYTNFPEIETVRAKRKSWKERIMDPFNDALAKLEDNGLLSDWYYCKSGGEMLTDEIASNFSSYEEWSEVLVHFSLKDPPNHIPRIEAKIEEKKKTTRKRKPKKKTE